MHAACSSKLLFYKIVINRVQPTPLVVSRLITKLQDVGSNPSRHMRVISKHNIRLKILGSSIMQKNFVH